MLAEALRGDLPCLGLSDLAGGDGQKLWETARSAGFRASSRSGVARPTRRAVWIFGEGQSVDRLSSSPLSTST